MPDNLFPLEVPSGLSRNGTRYQSRGRWHDSHLVRFYSGTVQPIGGWRNAQTDAGVDVAALAGIPRGMFTWRSLSGNTNIAIGTTEKLYVMVSGTLYDITPVGFVVGAEDTTSAIGAYGAGSYGDGSYGEGAVTTALTLADTWHFDSFGDYLLALSTSDGKIYVWDGVTSNVATEVDISAATGTPTTSAGVVATPERFVMALGTSNQRRVTWANQAGYTTWGPLVTNSAGSWDLQTNGKIMAGQRTKNETLIWTDVDVHSARYVGGVGIYRFDQVGDRCGLISRRAKVVVDTLAFWMGKSNFFVYDGYTRTLPSEVRDYVFSDFNQTQAAKVWAMSVSQYGEVWWFYPSSRSTECDRYVVFNYQENHWTTGQMGERTTGVDSGPTQYPIVCDSSGYMYEHEIGNMRPAVAFGQPGIILYDESGIALMDESGDPLLTEQTAPYLESGPIEVGNGDQLMSLQRLVPDEKTLGDVFAKIFSALYPTDPEIEHGPYTLANPTPVRINARQVRVRLEEAVETAWRVGVIRLGLRPSSRR